MTTYTSFGWATARITRPDIVETTPKVGISWSAVGEVDLKTAEGFVEDLQAAIQSARAAADELCIETPVSDKNVDIHAMLANYDPASEPTPWWRNHFHCEICGNDWTEEFDLPNAVDECPKCACKVTAHDADDLTDD
jgi:hypothetical protein